jgi:hypothetical protein
LFLVGIRLHLHLVVAVGLLLLAVVVGLLLLAVVVGLLLPVVAAEELPLPAVAAGLLLR